MTMLLDDGVPEHRDASNPRRADGRPERATRYGWIGTGLGLKWGWRR
jgi:hypothetical protein